MLSKGDNDLGPEGMGTSIFIWPFLVLPVPQMRSSGTRETWGVTRAGGAKAGKMLKKRPKKSRKSPKNVDKIIETSRQTLRTKSTKSSKQRRQNHRNNVDKIIEQVDKIIEQTSTKSSNKSTKSMNKSTKSLNKVENLRNETGIVFLCAGCLVQAARRSVMMNVRRVSPFTFPGRLSYAIRCPGERLTVSLC